MRVYYTFVSAFYIPKCCEMVQKFYYYYYYYYLHKTISMHSMFGTCLCIGKAQDRWVLKSKDGSNGKRTHRGSIICQVNEQWTHLPLENEEDLINIWI